MTCLSDVDENSSRPALSGAFRRLAARGRMPIQDLSKLIMGPRAQIALVVGVALAFCLLIQCVTSALDRSFVAKRTIEFQESQLAAVNQVAQRLRWQFQKLNDALHGLSQIPDVQFVQTNEALLHLIRTYRMNAEMVDAIFRLDKNGALQLAYPEDTLPPFFDELRPILERARLTGDTAYQVIHRNWNGNDVLVIAKRVYVILEFSHKSVGMICNVRRHGSDEFVAVLYHCGSRPGNL